MTLTLKLNPDPVKVSALVKSVVANALKDAEKNVEKPKSIMQIYNEVGRWGFTVEKIIVSGYLKGSDEVPVGDQYNIVGWSSRYTYCVLASDNSSIKHNFASWRLVK